MASPKISFLAILLSLLGALQSHKASGSEVVHKVQIHEDHYNHVDPLSQDASPQHLSVRDSFLDAKKQIDEKYLDCDPNLIKLIKTVEDAMKTHNHTAATAAIIEIRNFKPSTTSTDPCKAHPFEGKDGSHTLPHNHASSLSAGSIWNFKNLAIITSAMLALMLK